MSQVNSFDGGAALPGDTLSRSDVKSLTLRHFPDAITPVDSVYNPLTEKTQGVLPCVFKRNGQVEQVYDPLSRSVEVELGGSGGDSELVVVQCPSMRSAGYIEEEKFNIINSAVDSGKTVVIQTQEGSSGILYSLQAVGIAEFTFARLGTSDTVITTISRTPIPETTRHSVQFSILTPITRSQIGEGLEFVEDKLKVKLGRGLKFDSEQGVEGTVSIDDTTQEVVAAVQKLERDLDSKVTSTMALADITDCYDLSSTEYGHTGNLITQAFTVPINNGIRINDTKLSVYAKQNYATKIILGLYEFDFEGNEGTGQTVWIGDTGPVTVMEGRNDFPLKHLADGVEEIKADRVYYAAIYFPQGKTTLCLLAGCEGYNENINAVPKFTVGADNISIDMSDPDSSLENFGPWSSGYNERNQIPRFLMQIRNTDGVPPTPVVPFDNIDDFTLTVNDLSGTDLPEPSSQNGILCKKVIPHVGVSVKAFEYYDIDDGQYAHENAKSIFNADGSVLATGTITKIGEYHHFGVVFNLLRVEFSTPVQLVNTVYHIPVSTIVPTLQRQFVSYSGSKRDSLRLYDSIYNMQYGPSNDTEELNAVLVIEDVNSVRYQI